MGAMEGSSPELSRQLSQDIQNKHMNEWAGMILGANQCGSALWVPRGGSLTWSSQEGFLDERPGEGKERREPLGRGAGSCQLMGAYAKGLTGGKRTESHQWMTIWSGGPYGWKGIILPQSATHRTARPRDPGQQTKALTLKPPPSFASPARPLTSPT